jgi:endonuclease YncB( thermonuclease family)
MSPSVKSVGGFVLVFLVLACFQTASALGPRHDLFGSGRVVDVEAPNLLKIKLQNKDKIITVRLIGVGSPKNRERLKGLGQDVQNFIFKFDVWEQSRDYVKSLLQNKTVQVWTRKWDSYDEKHRLLAYVRIPAQEGDPVDLNGEIIRNGMGFVTRDYVHVTFADYRSFEQDAKKHSRGIWRGISTKRISSNR